MQEIGLSKEKPSIYERLKQAFNVNFDDGIIIADGNTIHCKYNIPPEKIVHELVHIKQQEKVGRDLWWDLYISNPSFRLEQEVEAYKKEYEFICDNIKDRNIRFEFLYGLAQALSSSQYGKLCTGDEAMRLIQS